jgi:hypothetical protein
MDPLFVEESRVVEHFSDFWGVKGFIVEVVAVTSDF